MKKNGAGVILVLIVLVAGIVLYGGERLFAVQIHKNNMISSAEELGVRITDQLMKGNTSFSTYVNGLSEANLVGINHGLDGFFGHVASYTVLRKVNPQVQQVRFDLELSDNYYVYQNVVHGVPIEDNEIAQSLTGTVQEILGQCDGMTDYEKMVYFHDYLVTHTVYGFLSGDKEELSYTAAGSLLYGTSVCNGYAEAMELLLMCSGIDTYMVVGTADGESHAWNIVKLNGEWYHVDVTWDDPLPDTEDQIVHVYLNIDDAVMERTHTWNRDAYPVCTSMELNYYEQEGAAVSSFNEFKVYVLKQMRETDRIELMVKNAQEEQYDCGFVVKSGGAKSVNWQEYEGEDYTVMVITIQK